MLPSHRLPLSARPAPRAAAVVALALALASALTGGSAAAVGKLPLTGGVASVEGAAGGGLTPWAMTGTRATGPAMGVAASLATLRTADHRLRVATALWALGDRLELSLARQDFDAGATLAPLGLPALVLRQDVAGVKLRLVGDALLDADRPWPQVSLGVQHRRTDAGGLAPTLHGVLGARARDTEFYLAATKLWLEAGLLTHVTLRATRANQFGLLGFGGAGDRRHHVQPELSVAWLARRDLAVGAEWRRKGHALRRSALGDGALDEDDAVDLFVAWAPLASLTFTLAWVDLGRVAPGLQPRRQRGAYAALQWSP